MKLLMSQILTLIKIEIKKVLWSHAMRGVVIAMIVTSALWGAFFWYAIDTYGESEKPEIDYSFLETEEYKVKAREEIKAEIIENEARIDELGMDYVRYRNSKLQYELDNDFVSIHNEPSAYHYVIFTIQTIGTIFVILVMIVFSNLFYSEHKNGTEKLLYTKPYSRIAIVMSKYLCGIVIALALTGILYAILLISGGCLTTFDGGLSKTIYTFGDTVICQGYVFYSLAYMGVFFISLLITGTISFVLTGITKSRMIGIGTGLILNFAGFTVVSKLCESGKDLWTNFFFGYSDLLVFFDRPLPESFTVWKAALWLSLVVVAMLALLCVIIRRRDVK